MAARVRLAVTSAARDDRHNNPAMAATIFGLPRTL
uniref:Uncharacterized protein n=1 Tax=Cucumis melo TaxID=3656 RepID=A0A9I9CCY7_CUCME